MPEVYAVVQEDEFRLSIQAFEPVSSPAQFPVYIRP